MDLSISTQTLLSVVGCIGCILFGVNLYRFPNKKTSHKYLSSMLILAGFSNLLRAIYWETQIERVNQLANFSLIVLPIIILLSIESITRLSLRRFQKIIVILSSTSLFALALFIQLNHSTYFLIPFVLYHYTCLMFCIATLHRAKGQMKNLKEKNIVSCLFISFITVIFLAGFDWVTKFGYLNIRLFPLSFSIFIYYLSIIIYTPGSTAWKKQTVKLFCIFTLAAVITAISSYTTKVELSVSLLLICFSILTSSFAIFNQLHSEKQSLVDGNRNLFQWKLRDTKENLFLEEINKNIEFHHVNLIEPSYIKSSKAEACYTLFKGGHEILSREDLMTEIQKTERTRNYKDNYKRYTALEQALYLLDISASDYLSTIPYTDSLIAIKFIDIVSPDLYSDYISGLAHKISLIKTKKREV